MSKFEFNLEPIKKYESIEIHTDHDATYVAERIGEIKKHIKAVEAQRLEYTRPLDDAKEALIRDERKVTDPLKGILKTLDRKMVDWTLSQENIRRLAAEQKRQEELKALAEERERQLALAATTGNEEAAKAVEEIERNHEVLAATQIFISNKISTHTGRWTMTKRWKAEVVDVSQVPKEFLCVDEKKLQAYAQAMKGDATVPGVKFIEIRGGMSS